MNKMEKEAMEEMTLKFLRDNDPLFTARSKNLKMEYPYHSQRQTGIRNSKEIPVSNLTVKQKGQAASNKMGELIVYHNDYL